MIKPIKLWLCLSLILLVCTKNYAQKAVQNTNNSYKLTYKSAIIPTALIAYGVLGFHSDAIRNLDEKIKNNFRYKNKEGIDDYLQYIPPLSLYFKRI